MYMCVSDGCRRVAGYKAEVSLGAKCAECAYYRENRDSISDEAV